MKHSLSRRSFLETSLFAGASTLVAVAARVRQCAHRCALRVRAAARRARRSVGGAARWAIRTTRGLRGQIALARTGEGAALPLEGPFGLHPALSFMHASYAAKELAVLHAVASPYRERSHFDAQNVLESGDMRPHGSTSGWINRALTALPAGKSREAGVALGANVPLAMRGPAEVASWSPTKIAALDDATLARITDLYARDPLLSQRLADALESDAIANEAQAAAQARAGSRGDERPR